ncbi:hypothetical protein M758_2G220100 [Ceratodon purpureus]|nr:hypothetical protein M758_2G220100 [Ceratodon purpureus]
MAAVNPACVFGRDVRGLSGSSGLLERVLSGKVCSSSGKGRVAIGRKAGYARVSDFVGSIKGGSVRCSSLPGDSSSPGTSKSLGKSGSSKNLRWVEEDVAVAAENGVRSVSVVQAMPEDMGLNGATGMLAELLESDRPQPVGGYGAGNQMSLEMMDAMRGQEVQAMSAVLYRPKLLWFTKSEDEENRFIDRTFNALLAGAAISYAFTKAVTVDHDVWHGWTMFEVLKYAPLHSWHAYEEVLQSNPILAKMTISGIVYSIGDWIGQCVEGKPVLEFSRVRLLRSGLVGFCLHGSLSHHYYHVCEFLFPFQGWWVVPLKVAFDQTIWSAIWNSIYFIALGLLRFESPVRIFKDLRETFIPCLTAGWKLWPFAHLITYGLVPVEQRLLWVDCVEIVWVTILSMFANEKAQQRLESGEEGVLVLVAKEAAPEENLSSKDSQ